MASSNQPEKKRFVIEESGAEMAWLLDADKTVTDGMGGLFPERTEEEMTTIYEVLDLGCGCGGWVMNVAQTYPDMEVMGVDVSKQMINYARAHAQVRNLRNAHFREMDILDPLGFPDNAFDLVNSRILFGFMTPQTWPLLLQESKRVLRSGGIFRMTEMEVAMTNSPAFARLWGIYMHAMHVSQRTFATEGTQIGTLPHMGRLLHEAGFQNVQSKAYMPEFSYNTPGHESWYQNIQFVCKLVQPFCVKTGVTTPEEYEQAYEAMLTEMVSPEFCGIVPMLTVWGEKP